MGLLWVPLWGDGAGLPKSVSHSFARSGASFPLVQPYLRAIGLQRNQPTQRDKVKERYSAQHAHVKSHCATSAPGLGSTLPHLRRDWARRCHICTGTGLTPATSAPGLGSSPPHLHRDWAHPSHIGCSGHPICSNQIGGCTTSSQESHTAHVSARTRLCSCESPALSTRLPNGHTPLCRTGG
jgi:hypothetical protein